MTPTSIPLLGPRPARRGLSRFAGALVFWCWPCPFAGLIGATPTGTQFRLEGDDITAAETSLLYTGMALVLIVALGTPHRLFPCPPQVPGQAAGGGFWC